MNKTQTAAKKLSIILLMCVLVVGFLLRHHQYATWPREGATFDEYAWPWLGLNIITRGIPISWSPHPQYKIRNYYDQRGAKFWLVQPYLEHPPLFGLVAGAYAFVRGIPDMFHVRLHIIRELSLILGIASIALVYGLSLRLYDSGTAVIASAVYAIMPTAVIGSRILQNENFFIPVFLASLLFTHTFLTTKKTAYFIWAAALCSLLVLAKIPWIAATIAVSVLLVSEKKYVHALLVWLFAFVSLGIFTIWGMSWDVSVFTSLWKLQLHRYDIGFDSIFSLLTQPYLVDRYYLDGFIVAGWIAVAVLSSSLRTHKYLFAGMLGYFLIYILAIPNEPSHGWYRYPFYPFLAIALGYIGAKFRSSYSALVPFLLLLIGLSLFSHTWEKVFGFSFIVYRGYIVWSFGNIVATGIASTRVQKFFSFSVVMQAIVVALLAIWSVMIYTEQ